MASRGQLPPFLRLQEAAPKTRAARKGREQMKHSAIRSFFLALVLVIFPIDVWAIEAPSGQIQIDATKVLRGRFIEQHQLPGAQAPLTSSGHFIVAPARGLIWGIERPFPTTTIVTPNGAAQDIGGMAMKLPAKNLRHLYDMVGGALAGDWNGLETDFEITSSGDGRHWQMTLTPRQNDKPKLSYARITASGGPFVENIVMTKADGSYDAFNFTDPVLSQAPLAANESAVFSEVRP